MTDLQQRKWGLTLIAISLALIGIGSAQNQLEVLFQGTLPAFWNPLVMGAAILSLGAGLGFWIVSFWPSRVWSDCYCRLAEREELRLVYRFARWHLGRNISPLETMESWHDLNPTIFYVAIIEEEREVERKKKVVGYFCAIPLKATARNPIEKGEITGRNIGNDHIAGVGDSYDSIYFGGIAAKRWDAKGALVATLNKEYPLKTAGSVKTFYTRPINRVGKKLAERKGFKAVSPDNDGKLNVIYRLQM